MCKSGAKMDPFEGISEGTVWPTRFLARAKWVIGKFHLKSRTLRV